MSNLLRETLEAGKFAITAEITPPRGADFDSLAEAVTILKPAVAAVNLTDGAGARVRMSSLAASIYVKQAGIEPIMQITCRDRNRIAIESDLLGAAAFGISNVLALTGDSIDAGDNSDAKSVFDFKSSELLAALRTSNVPQRRLFFGTTRDCIGRSRSVKRGAYSMLLRRPLRRPL